MLRCPYTGSLHYGGAQPVFRTAKEGKERRKDFLRHAVAGRTGEKEEFSRLRANTRFKLSFFAGAVQRFLTKKNKWAVEWILDSYSLPLYGDIHLTGQVHGKLRGKDGYSIFCLEMSRDSNFSYDFGGMVPDERAWEPLFSSFLHFVFEYDHENELFREAIALGVDQRPYDAIIDKMESEYRDVLPRGTGFVVVDSSMDVRPDRENPDPLIQVIPVSFSVRTLVEVMVKVVLLTKYARGLADMDEQSQRPLVNASHIKCREGGDGDSGMRSMRCPYIHSCSHGRRIVENGTEVAL